MNIELYEGQKGRIRITLNGEFMVYGGTTKERFASGRHGDDYIIVIPAQYNTTCYDPRFDIFAKRIDGEQEWLVESGRIVLKQRHSSAPADAISSMEYHITKELVESGETIEAVPMIIGIKGDKGDTGEQGIRGERGERGEQGIQGIQGIQGERGFKGDTGERGEQGIQGERGEKGEPGLSAYELVKLHGYTGTEAEFTDMLQTFEASAQKSVDAQIIAENCAVNALKYLQEAQAILEEIKGVTTS